MILYIVLSILIIILILVIINKNKEIKRISSLYEKIKSAIKKNDDELEFAKREIERCHNQISIYEEKEVKKIAKKNKAHKISVNPIYKDMKALVGDYCDATAKNTKEILNSFGFNVDIVKSGSDIVDRISHGYKYDIIITNNTYPKDISGTDVLRDLQSIENFNIPIVIHTYDRENKSFFLNYFGFDGYVAKPMTIESLKPILDKIFKNKKGIK